MRAQLAQVDATESRSLARSMVELRGVVRDWAPEALEE